MVNSKQIVKRRVNNRKMKKKDKIKHDDNENRLMECEEFKE